MPRPRSVRVSQKFVLSETAKVSKVLSCLVTMGKTVELAKENPFGERTAELHALTRAEEEACYKEMKARALEYCQAPIKGSQVEIPTRI